MPSKRITILYICLLDLKNIAGDSVNEIETLRCLDTQFKVLLVSCRYVGQSSVRRPALESSKPIQTYRHGELPMINLWGIRMIQYLVLSLGLAVMLPFMKHWHKFEIILVRNPITCACLLPIARRLKIPVVYRTLSVAFVSREKVRIENSIVGFLRLAPARPANLWTKRSLAGSRIPARHKQFGLDPRYSDVMSLTQEEWASD